MKRIELLSVLGEGMLWIGLAILSLCLTALVGCGEGRSPLAPEEGNEMATVGELKTDTHAISTGGKDITVVKTVVGGAPMAPNVVKVIKAGESHLDISLSHEEGEGGEIIAIKTTDGDLLNDDKIRIYVDGNYIGRVRVETKSPLSEIHVLIEDKDLPAGEVMLEVEISRDGKIIADEEIEIERLIITVPTLESVEAGDFEDEIVLTFSDDVNAYREIKDNISVVFDGAKLRVRSYEESGDKITLIMRKDLSPGSYAIAYNGDGGLEDLDGERIDAFEATLIIEGEDTVATEETTAATWKTIPHGLYGSGSQMLIALEAFGYKVSPWTRQILSADTFSTEEDPGNTDLYRVTPEELGLTGTYTAADVIVAAVKSGYRLVPDETAAQLRLLYANQPQGELVAVISKPLTREHSTYVLAIGGGSAQYPGKWLIAVNVTATLNAEYSAFIVTK